MMILLLLLLSSGSCSSVVSSFGIVTDVHYADADTTGTRFYRDSLPKMRDAVATFNSANLSFVIELGDLKDKEPTDSVEKTLGFLDDIEKALAAFSGPRFHVLGNHDVDLLTQEQVLSHITNIPVHSHEGVYSFDIPCPSSSSAPQDLHFVVLNGDFNKDGTPWANIDHNSSFSWSSPWVTTAQLAWLASDVAVAGSRGQKTIVFVHYRLDGSSNTSKWVQECTLENAKQVREVLEAPGSGVLGTFSGHDHNPSPPFTVGESGVLYFTHHAMVEGAYPQHNAYSVVDVHDDCSLHVRGYGDAVTYTHPGPAGCSLN